MQKFFRRLKSMSETDIKLSLFYYRTTYATAVKGKRYRQFLKISDTIKPDFLYTDEGMIQ